MHYITDKDIQQSIANLENDSYESANRLDSAKIGNFRIDVQSAIKNKTKHIYGIDGSNRYIVRLDGEVVFVWCKSLKTNKVKEIVNKHKFRVDEDLPINKTTLLKNSK